jgi:hypothetical protein
MWRTLQLAQNKSKGTAIRAKDHHRSVPAAKEKRDSSLRTE